MEVAEAFFLRSSYRVKLPGLPLENFRLKVNRGGAIDSFGLADYLQKHWLDEPADLLDRRNEGICGFEGIDGFEDF